MRNKGIDVAKPRLRFVPAQGVDRPALYLHMFEEDVRLAVAPIGSSRLSKEFKVSISGEAYHSMRAEALLQSFARDHYGNQERMVTEAIRMITMYMLHSGVARYEILAAKKSGEKNYFLVHPFPLDKIIRVPTGFIQINALNPANSGWVFLPIENAWVLRIPKSLTSIRGLKRLKQELNANTGFPKIDGMRLAHGKLSPGFSFTEFKKMSRLALLQSTRKWGWIGRDYTMDHETEFYLVYRILRFRWAAAMLREHILRGINSLLNRLSILSKVTIEGLLPPSGYLLLQERLLKGEIDFKAALQQGKEL